MGSHVKHVKIGDRVASFVFGTYDQYNGAFAEVVKSNGKNTWVLPEGVSEEEGAAFTVGFFLSLFFSMGFFKTSSNSNISSISRLFSSLT